jgi:hypothetical protein
MANSIVANNKGAYTNIYGKLRAALANQSQELGQLFAAPSLCRSPDYTFDALTEDANAFTVWDSDDPLDNSNAERNGEASPALLFPANTLTPVEAFTLVANDDTVGAIAVRALVLGSATAPTLVSAFENTYTLKATFATAAATRVLAESTPGFTITSAAVATGRYTIALPSGAKAINIACGCDMGAATVASEGTHFQPNAVVTATGAGEVRLYGDATPALNAPTDTHILHVVARVRETNGHVWRHTQDSADTGDTLLKFGINTSPTPDSLILQVTGIASAELRWAGAVWIGERLPVAFRTQA